MFSTKYAGWWEVNVVLLIKTFLFSFYRLYKKKKKNPDTSAIPLYQTERKLMHFWSGPVIKSQESAVYFYILWRDSWAVFGSFG